MSRASELQEWARRVEAFPALLAACKFAVYEEYLDQEKLLAEIRRVCAEAIAKAEGKE